MATFAHTRELREAQFVDVDLRAARFVDADLSGVVMRAVEVSGRTSMRRGSSTATASWSTAST